MKAVSVIVPVFNVEQYLPRCLNCILGQTLKDIEIICVDDGSTDGSGAILDDYAKRDKRIRVVHQANAGAGAARNVGLAMAAGEYLFFFDPDDTCDVRMLEGMYKRAKKTDADIVIAGKVVVDAATGRIKARYGFHRDIWRFRQPFSAAEISDHIFTLAKSVPWDKLFRREFIVANGFVFQNTRRCNDVRFVDMALASAKRIALVPRAYYRYSEAREGSLQENKDRHPLAFLDAYDALRANLEERDLLETFLPCYCRVFLRTALFNLRHLAEPQNIAVCYREVRCRLQELDRRYDFSADVYLGAFRRRLCAVILANESPEMLFEEFKGYGRGGVRQGRSVLKWLRRTVPLPIRETVKRIRSRLTGPVVDPSAEVYNVPLLKAGVFTNDFIEVTPHGVVFRFTYRNRAQREFDTLPGGAKLLVETGSGISTVEPVGGPIVFSKALDADGSRHAVGRRFTCSIPLAAKTPCSIRWGFDCEEALFTWGWVIFGLYSPFNSRQHCYFRKDGWILRRNGKDQIEVVCDTVWERIRSFGHRLSEAACCPRLSSVKALMLVAAAELLGLFARRRIWLFSDRIDRADDNARALFEYAVSLPRDGKSPKCVFAISKASPDYAEMQKVGKVVDINSLRYKLMFLRASAVISAYRTPLQRCPFGKGTLAHLKRTFALRYRFVFLRHGICEKDVSADLSRERVNVWLILASTAGECAALQSPAYGFPAENVRLTGMPRYDRLQDDRKGFITFMPTWRNYLTLGAGTNRLEDHENFRSSAFCTAYKAVLGDAAFAAECAARGFKVRMMMHPNMRDALGDLGIAANVEILPPEASYRDVFATSDLVVTDYSSVAFDFGYLRKPVLYYQFDFDEFFTRQYSKADFFDYARDGFGEVETSADALKKRILEYASSGCRMKPEYEKRVEGFFAFTDRNNCKRVYEAILKAEAEDRARS